MNSKFNPKKSVFISYKSNEDLNTFLKSKLINPEKRRIRLLSSKEIKEGRWTFEEHDRFLKACYLYGSDWRKVYFLNLGRR
jgi:hypothetical protein